jgi:succinate dehydrogenase/fumarate reductase-like Fe-S protein
MKNTDMKRNKEPMNTSTVQKMKRAYKETYKGITWSPCIMCGDLCPQSATDERYKDLDNVHLTCRYDAKYEAKAKEVRKQRALATKTSLF